MNKGLPYSLSQKLIRPSLFLTPLSNNAHPIIYGKGCRFILIKVLLDPLFEMQNFYICWSGIMWEPSR